MVLPSSAGAAALVSEVPMDIRQKVDLDYCARREAGGDVRLVDAEAFWAFVPGRRIGIGFLGRSGRGDGVKSILAEAGASGDRPWFEFKWKSYPVLVQFIPGRPAPVYRAMIAVEDADGGVALYPICSDLFPSEPLSKQREVLPGSANLVEMTLRADTRAANALYVDEHINDVEGTPETYTLFLVTWYPYNADQVDYIKDQLSVDLETWWLHAVDVFAGQTETPKAPWLCKPLKFASAPDLDGLVCAGEDRSGEPVLMGTLDSQTLDQQINGLLLADLELELVPSGSGGEPLKYSFGWNENGDLQTVVQYGPENDWFEQAFHVSNSELIYTQSGSVIREFKDPLKGIGQPGGTSFHARLPYRKPQSAERPSAEDPVVASAELTTPKPASSQEVSRTADGQNCAPGRIATGCDASAGLRTGQPGSVNEPVTPSQDPELQAALARKIFEADRQDDASPKAAADGTGAQEESPVPAESASAPQDKPVQEDVSAPEPPETYPVRFLFQSQSDWAGAGAVVFDDLKSCTEQLTQSGLSFASTSISPEPAGLRLSKDAAIAVLRQGDVVAPCATGELVQESGEAQYLHFKLRLFVLEGPPLVVAISPAKTFYDRRMEPQVKETFAGWVNGLIEAEDTPAVKIVVIDGDRSLSTILDPKELITLAGLPDDRRQHQLIGLTSKFSFAVRSMRPAADTRVLFEMAKDAEIKHLIYLVDSTREAFYLEDLGPVYALLLKRKIPMTVASLGSCEGWDYWFADYGLSCHEVGQNGQNLERILKSVTEARGQ
jgi:hypothetical protein